jgi:hypothetical protein
MFKQILAAWRQRKFDAMRRDYLQSIEKHGWTAVYVGDYVTAPSWAYTAGFHATLGAPEVLVFDIPQDYTNGLFHEIYGDLRAGLVIKDGERWRPGELEHPLVWRKIHESRLYDRDPENPWLGLAEDFAAILAPDKGPICAFQLVASDAEDRMPWDAGYEERLRPRQRALWEPLDLAARTGV